MPDPALSVSPETETLVVAGPPGTLRGELRLRNDSNEKLKIRGARLTSRRGAEVSDFGQMQVGVRLQPGEEAVVPLELSLGADTAPGVYDLEMDVGGRSVAVRAHVTPHVDLRIEPAAITLLVGADRVVEHEFVAQNAGNVPLALGARCEAPLSDSVDFMTAFREGIRKTVGVELKPRFEQIFDEVGRMQVGSLLVHRERTTLKPGECRQMSARFEVPEDIKPGRHYRASLELYNATLRVDIYTTEKVSRRRAANKG
ncbi:MAG TPA: hypothetical protein VG095_05900 [Chthoniobacterales bacterium]|nr:hypothetical protein [Chthoniobacterales bacterium]